MSNFDTKIRKRIIGDRRTTKFGRPVNTRGRDGDLSLNITKEGIGLFGKVRNKWYQFGSAQKVGQRGRINRGDISQNDHFNNVDIDGYLHLKKAKINVTDNDDLSIDSSRFDVDCTTGKSLLSIGELDMQSTWHDSSGDGIANISVSGEGAELVIKAGTHSEVSGTGGTLYLAPGTSSGTIGNVVIGKTLASNGSELAATPPLFGIHATATQINGTLEVLSTGTALKLTHNANDYATFTVADTGDLTIATVGDGTTDSDLTLVPDGDLVLDPASNKIIINATDDLYFDGGGDTYITENSTDNLRFYVGGDLICSMAENGSAGNQMHVSGASLGFNQKTPTFDATDTDVDFRTSNKQKLTLTDNCTDIHFQFPAMSGNFICVLLQDGTGGRTISNWKTKDAAGNAGAGNSGLVLWAGGTAPSNTETADKADIVSIYWDAIAEIAYGTYTYNF